MKKEGILGSGFLDESEIEQELNEYGLSGWELVSVLEVQDGMMAFFKQPFGSVRKSGLVDADEAGGDNAERRLREVEAMTVESVGDEATEERKEKPDENDNSIGAIRIE